MPVGRNIQVYGIDAVLQCYDNAAITAWAVVCDKNVNMKYAGDDKEEGRELLRAYLEMVKDHDSKAAYTLRLYEDLEGKQIRSNTACDIAFNFALQDRGELEPSRNLPAVQGMGSQTLMALLREISDYKTTIAKLELQAESNEAYIEELEQTLKELQKNQVQEKTMGMQLFEKCMPAIGRIGEGIAEYLMPKKTALAGIQVSAADDEKMISESITRLKKSCTKYSVGQVLSKIADIADNDPGQFDFYLKMLMK